MVCLCSSAFKQTDNNNDNDNDEDGDDNEASDLKGYNFFFASNYTSIPDFPEWYWL